MNEFYSLTFLTNSAILNQEGREKPMRISKPPEVRKQEILDQAIRIFSQKGYEKTSISDIAKALGISQGLCYRYFPSKEAIYDATLEQYADYLIEHSRSSLDYEGKTLKEQIKIMSGNVSSYTKVEKELPEMYELFHKEGSKEIHDQLYLRISQKMVPLLIPYLQSAKERGEIQVHDIETVAYFFVYGQIGMLKREDISNEEKKSRIQSTLFELLGLQ